MEENSETSNCNTRRHIDNNVAAAFRHQYWLHINNRTETNSAKANRNTGDAGTTDSIATPTYSSANSSACSSPYPETT